MDKCSSTSILHYFLKNNLNNAVDIRYIRYGGKYRCLSLGRKFYRYYIQLEKKIKDYDVIVLSRNASEYLLAGGDINNLRVRHYPWPELIRPSDKTLESGYYNEADSIKDVYVRYTFKHPYMYTNNIPKYDKIIVTSFMNVKKEEWPNNLDRDWIELGKVEF